MLNGDVTGVRIQDQVDDLCRGQVRLSRGVQVRETLDTTRQSDLTSAEIINLVLDPYTRHVAIQHVISLVVFKSVDFSARSRLSMLPTPIASFLKAMPRDEPGECNAEGTTAIFPPSPDCEDSHHRSN